jgi:hypothetical protein
MRNRTFQFGRAILYNRRMSEQFPEHIIQLYKERLHTTYGILTTALSRTPETCAADTYDALKVAVHKLVGVAGYFDDDSVVKKGRELDTLFKAYPNSMPPDTTPLLTIFRQTLLHSSHFKP